MHVAMREGKHCVEILLLPHIHNTHKSAAKRSLRSLNVIVIEIKDDLPMRQGGAPDEANSVSSSISQ